MRALRVLLRGPAVLLVCACLALASLAAAGGTPKDPGAAVVAAARAHLGDTYEWGAEGPHTWDCSGLTSTLWREVGGVKDIPRTSRQQQAWALPLPAEQLRAGDLAFFGEPVTHVGIVVRTHTTKAGTAITMLDASSSQHGVVERAVWHSGVVRFGRVPRRGMVPIAPWTPPAPPVTTTAPATAKAPAKAPTPAKAPAAKPASRLAPGKTPLTALPHGQSAPSSKVALKAVTLAKAALGNTTLSDLELVANVWRRAGGPSLPATRSGLKAAAHRVPVSDARVGDLVVYAAPASHVGIYVGGGLMVDASRVLGKVVLRQVWAGQGVQIQRLGR